MSVEVRSGLQARLDALHDAGLKTVIGPKDWSDFLPYGFDVPDLPEELTEEVLKKPSPLVSHRTIGETSVLLFIPKKVQARDFARPELFAGQQGIRANLSAIGVALSSIEKDFFSSDDGLVGDVPGQINVLSFKELLERTPNARAKVRGLGSQFGPDMDGYFSPDEVIDSWMLVPDVSNSEVFSAWQAAAILERENQDGQMLESPIGAYNPNQDKTISYKDHTPLKLESFTSGVVYLAMMARKGLLRKSPSIETILWSGSTYRYKGIVLINGVVREDLGPQLDRIPFVKYNLPVIQGHGAAVA